MCVFSVLGGQESRGVLRKISDMLEVIMKRMDALSKLGNTSDTHRLDELSSALDRYSVLVSNACQMCFALETVNVTRCHVGLVSEEGSMLPAQTLGKLQQTSEESTSSHSLLVMVLTVSSCLSEELFSNPYVRRRK